MCVHVSMPITQQMLVSAMVSWPLAPKRPTSPGLLYPHQLDVGHPIRAHAQAYCASITLADPHTSHEPPPL